MLPYLILERDLSLLLDDSGRNSAILSVLTCKILRLGGGKSRTFIASDTDSCSDTARAAHTQRRHSCDTAGAEERRSQFGSEPEVKKKLGGRIVP